MPSWFVSADVGRDQEGGQASPLQRHCPSLSDSRLWSKSLTPAQPHSGGGGALIYTNLNLEFHHRCGRWMDRLGGIFTLGLWYRVGGGTGHCHSQPAIAPQRNEGADAVMSLEWEILQPDCLVGPVCRSPVFICSCNSVSMIKSLKCGEGEPLGRKERAGFCSAERGSSAL